MIDTILFPSDFFNRKKADKALQAEYEAAINTGRFQIVLFNYDQWLNERKLVLSNTPKIQVHAVYRGWMMKPECYKDFYDELKTQNIHLITPPSAYELFHIFPNIYKYLSEDTAEIMIFTQGTKIDVEVVKKHFNRFMVKDYVKSVKGTEFPRFFTQDITQEEFDRWLEVFYKYRGNLFTGGICIKQYLNLKQYGGKVNEYRVFIINHKIATISRNSGQGNYTPLPPQKLLDKYKHLESPFFTLDCAELEDGTWKILEVGDGSVSGLSDGQDYEVFFRTLYQYFA